VGRPPFCLPVGRLNVAVIATNRMYIIWTRSRDETGHSLDAIARVHTMDTKAAWNPIDHGAGDSLAEKKD
jgi:ERCC4-type nuclease